MKRNFSMALFYAALGSCTPVYIPPPTLSSSIKQISTPAETQQWLNTVLAYESDPTQYDKEDFWAPCGLTYNSRKGDCEDYAICAATILREDVEEGYIIVINNPKEENAHAVFAYRMDGKWGAVSNNPSEFSQPEYLSLHGLLISYFSKDYTEYRIYNYEGIDLIDGNENLEVKLKLKGKYVLGLY